MNLYIHNYKHLNVYVKNRSEQEYLIWDKFGVILVNPIYCLNMNLIKI